MNVWISKMKMESIVVTRALTTRVMNEDDAVGFHQRHSPTKRFEEYRCEWCIDGHDKSFFCGTGSEGLSWKSGDQSDYDPTCVFQIAFFFFADHSAIPYVNLDYSKTRNDHSEIRQSDFIWPISLIVDHTLHPLAHRGGVIYISYTTLSKIKSDCRIAEWSSKMKNREEQLTHHRRSNLNRKGAIWKTQVGLHSD